MILAAGDVIDLRDYAVEGYKVSLATAEGDRCIGGYIVPDKDSELVLTYTVDDGANDTSEETNCQSVVGMNLMPLSIVALAILLKKKREDA